MNRRTKIALILGATLALIVVPDLVYAGTGGTEFSSIYTTLTGWMTGLLGRTIAVSFIIVGLVAGVVRQSIYGFVVGVAAGLGLFLAPAIVDSVVTATLPIIG